MLPVEDYSEAPRAFTAYDSMLRRSRLTKNEKNIVLNCYRLSCLARNTEQGIWSYYMAARTITPRLQELWPHPASPRPLLEQHH